MRLGFRILGNVQNVNSYNIPPSYTLYTGNPDTLYFQLVNLDQPGPQASNFGGTSSIGGGDYLRFMPASDAMVTANFNSIDLNLNLTKIAAQPFAASPADPSIWYVPILPSDQIAFNSMTLTLTTGGQSYTLLPLTELVSSGTDSSQFYC